MTSWERFKRTFEHREADRIPIIDSPWAGTLRRWRAEGHWISAGFWFGFDVAHSWMMGTETMLVAMLEEPEFVMDVFDTYLHSCEVLFGKIWDAGYHFDEIYWPDDMGYKGTTFFSPRLYRELLQPYHKRAVDWAHERGI